MLCYKKNNYYYYITFVCPFGMCVYVYIFLYCVFVLFIAAFMFFWIQTRYQVATVYVWNCFISYIWYLCTVVWATLNQTTKNISWKSKVYSSIFQSLYFSDKRQCIIINVNFNYLIRCIAQDYIKIPYLHYNFIS